MQNRSAEELAMRDLVVPKLRKLWPTARIIHELPTRYSTNRIDLAAVTETELVSVEIKSSRDVIDRLDGQIRAFLPVSHLLIVVLAPKWNVRLDPVERTNAKGWVSRTPRLTETQSVIRAAQSRANHRCITTWTCDAAAGALDTDYGEAHLARDARAALPWPAKMLHMLHVAELISIAERHQICTGRRLNHAGLVRACHDMMRGPEIVRATCRALRERAAFCAGTDDPIRAEAA